MFIDFHSAWPGWAQLNSAKKIFGDKANIGSREEENAYLGGLCSLHVLHFSKSAKRSYFQKEITPVHLLVHQNHDIENLQTPDLTKLGGARTKKIVFLVVFYY